MSILKVLHFPNPNLRIIAKPIIRFDDKIKKLIDDMFETMYDYRGVGLAATQVDRHLRAFVTDCAKEEEPSKPLVFINPEITSFSKEKVTNQEGCLSIPENHADIERAKFVTIKAQDKDGNEFIMNCDGLLAICVQHELDHLNGKLFIDYLSSAKQILIRDKMKKYEKRISNKQQNNN